eukprot:2634062-Pleurochrysis_carterae.AAC.1
MMLCSLAAARPDMTLVCVVKSFVDLAKEARKGHLWQGALGKQFDNALGPSQPELQLGHAKKTQRDVFRLRH